jgi:hypothetical protein
MILMRRKTLIDPMIEAKRSKIAATERMLEKLKIELAMLEQARVVVAAEPAPSSRSRPRTNGAATATGKKRGRSLSENWKRVLIAIASKGSSGATLDQIALFAAGQGIKPNRSALRAQMSNYVKGGYLGRTGEGNFFIALRGLSVAGLQAPASGDAQVSASAGSETGTLHKQGPGEWR